MSEKSVPVIYVDQLNGDDLYNNGSQEAPFKSLQSAVDAVPDFESVDIHILGDYVLTSNVSISVKANVTLILHGTLSTTEYNTEYSPSIRYPNYTGIYHIMVANAKVHIIVDSDNNGKIVVPAKSSSKPVAPDQSTMFTGSEFFRFTDIKFDLRVKQDDYNPIIVNSGFGLVSIDRYLEKKVKLNIKIIGPHPGRNRNIIVDSNSTLVSFKNAAGKFSYNYRGGLTNELNVPIPVSKCVDGDIMKAVMEFV